MSQTPTASLETHALASASDKPAHAHDLSAGKEDVASLAIARTRTLLQLWILHGLHTGRVAPGVSNLDAVSHTEATRLLTAAPVPDEERTELEQRACLLHDKLREVLDAPKADDRTGCRLFELRQALELSELAVDTLLRRASLS